MWISKENSDRLLALIRNGRAMTGGDKLNLIFQLSIPAILAQATNVLMFYIDASMVGMLGAKASAAIGIVEAATWLFVGLCVAAAMGFSVQVAHFIGANDFVKARQVLRHALVCTFIFSLLIAIVGASVAWRLPYWLGGGADIAADATYYFLVYALVTPFLQVEVLSSAMLKSSGNMRIPSLLSILMCVMDVAFNYLFIYDTHEVSWLGLHIIVPGAGLGVLGAAIGTALSITITGLVLAWFALFKSAALRITQDKMPFKWVWDYVWNAVKISAPMAAQYFLMGSAQVVSTMIVAPLGNFAIAANTFAVTAESLCYMPGYGIGDAATTLVGQSVGAGRRDLCRSFARMTVFTGMAVMAVMGVVMYGLAPEMIGVITPVKEIRELGIEALRIEAFAEPMFAASIVTYNVCLGAGDTLRPSLINLFSMWCVRLTLAAVLAPFYGLNGVWMAMAVELTFRGSLFLIRLYRGKWMRNVKPSPTSHP